MNSPERGIDMLPRVFEHARGETGDREWVELVLGRFYLENVNESLIRSELTQVANLVQASGEGPHELFGDPFDYVNAQIEQWRTDGAPVHPVEPPTNWRDIPVLAAVTATFIVAMFAVLELLSGNWRTEYTLGKVLSPALMSITALVTITTFETRLQHTRRLWALLIALIPALTGIALTVATFMIGNASPLYTGPLWWFAGLTALYAVIAIILHRSTPDSHTQRTPKATTPSRTTTRGVTAHGKTSADPPREPDEQWAAHLAGILRLRIEMPEKDVRATITEARQHASTNHRTLHEEFGSPQDFASRLPRSASGRRVRERWRRIAWILALPAFGYLAFEGLHHGWAWDNIRWVMAIAFTAACLNVAGFLRTRPPRKHPTTHQPDPRR